MSIFLYKMTKLRLCNIWANAIQLNMVQTNWFVNRYTIVQENFNTIQNNYFYEPYSALIDKDTVSERRGPLSTALGY